PDRVTIETKSELLGWQFYIDAGQILARSLFARKFAVYAPLDILIIGGEPDNTLLAPVCSHLLQFITPTISEDHYLGQLLCGKFLEPLEALLLFLLTLLLRFLGPDSGRQQENGKRQSDERQAG